MKRSRVLILLFSAVAALALLYGTLTLAAPVSPAASEGRLFIGVNDHNVPAYVGNLTTNTFTPVFSQTKVWGAAYDPDQYRILFTNAYSLWQWPIGGAPSFLGIITIDGEPGTMSGLAYHDGTLYASRIIGTENIYAIDLATLEATVAITINTSIIERDLGGIDIDPGSGTLYATNDAPARRGLVRIDPDGTITVVAPYPDGEFDLDGLAVGGGNAYLIPDSPRPIHVFNFATMTYTAPIPNPRTDITTTINAGGAYWEQIGYSLYLPALTR
jgi:hypothetical protein